MSDEPEVTKESLLQLASDFDAGKDIDSPAPAQAAVTPEPVDNPDPKPAEGAKQEAKAAADQTDKSKADKTQAPKADAEKQKSKWAQNEERKAKTWDDINAEKDKIRLEREAIQRERDDLQKSRLSPKEPLRDEHNASADDYREAAKQLKAKGDTASADAAEKLAGDLDAKEQTMRQHQALKEGQDKWNKNLDVLAEKLPDLKKPDSPLSKAALKVLETFPALKKDPDGIKYAVRAAEIELQAQEFEGTKAEFAKLKAEHEKLQKKLSISGGSPTDPVPPAKSFGDMSLKEQRQSLEQAVQQHDRDNGLS